MITKAMYCALVAEPPEPGTWHPAYAALREVLTWWMEHGTTEHLRIERSGLLVAMACDTAAASEPAPRVRELARVRNTRPLDNGRLMVWWVGFDDLGRSFAGPASYVQLGRREPVVIEDGDVFCELLDTPLGEL